MSRLLRPFRRLQWRLTLSYLLVTLVVVFAVEIINTVSVNTPPAKPDHPVNIFQKLEGTLLQQVGPQLLPYLDVNPPDRAALTKWATNFISPSHPGQKDGEQDTPSEYTLAVIFGSKGDVLAYAPGPETGGQPVFDQQSMLIIKAALIDDFNAADLVTPLANEAVAIAVPLKGFGAFYTIFKGPIAVDPPPADTSLAAKGNFVSLLLANLSSEFPLLALAGVIGILSGMLGSRGIRRPLRRIAQTADAWSRGNFSIKVQTRSRDELGQLARDLNSMADQLQNLITTRQELAVVEERHRLARDLHDSIKQQMFVITLLVGAAREMVADHPQAAQTLNEAVRLTGQAQQELTALIHELRPLALAGKGLSAALRELLTGWEQSTGITVEARLPDALTTPLPAEQALYRIAQEALNNVARHSGATHVTIDLLREPERLILRLQDNGHGFHPAQAGERGLGMSSMRQRARDVDGTLRIFSDATGTCVEASIPLAPAADGTAALPFVLALPSAANNDEEKHDPTFKPAHRG